MRLTIDSILSYRENAIARQIKCFAHLPVDEFLSKWRMPTHKVNHGKSQVLDYESALLLIFPQSIRNFDLNAVDH
jgi:hypothetical protein